jgi:F-type H+-transporting ATPase subunit a
MKMLEFKLFSPMSPNVISTLIIVVILALVFIIAGLKVKKLNPAETPKGFLFLCIALVDFLHDFLDEYISGKRLKFFGPYLFTLIVFLVVANTVALVGLTPPLANIGIAMSFSIITFIMIKVAEFKFQGIKSKLLGLLGPVKPLAPLMIPINLIGEVSTPFSMGLRLFVNIMSGVVISAMVFAIIGWFGSLFAGILLHAMFDIFFGLIQAFVFFMLTTVNLSMASES